MDLKEKIRLGETTLREMIEEFRRSRTINEERMTVQKYRGYLRENMNNLSNEQRSQGILKLMWMNMLGYDTEFALVECMNSLFIDSFQLKTLGYLGLTMFLSRKSEVLLMVTNRIRMDLEDQTNDFVVSAALKTFSEIADDQMAQELFPILKNLLTHESKYVRKKVCLAIGRVLHQKSDLVLELRPSFTSLLSENNNGLLLCSLHLARQVMTLKPKEFHFIFSDSLGHLLAKLRKTSSKSNGNYLINRVNDPFLQAALVDFLLEFLSLKQTQNLESYEDIVSEFGSCLLSVYNDIQHSSGSTARAILYQIARAIMQLPEASHALKKVGIAILGSFLQLKNRNYLFVSLKMLVFISKKYASEVSRHNSMIMRCVNDKDFSVKKLALEILLNTTDSDNLRDVSGLFFEELLKEKCPQHASQMAFQNLKLILKSGTTQLEIIEMTFRLLQCLASNTSIQGSELFCLFHLISNGSQSQLFASVKALFLLGNTDNLTKPNLVSVASWVLGEFSEVLTLGRDIKTSNKIPKISWMQIVQVLLKIDIKYFAKNLEVTNYILTAVLKIYSKVDQLKIKQIIVDWFINIARQQIGGVSSKAKQYLRIMQLTPSDLEEILESLSYKNETIDSKVIQKPEGEINFEDLQKLIEKIQQNDFSEQVGHGQSRNKGIMEEEHLLHEQNANVKDKKEDMDIMLLQENNGLQNEENGINSISLLTLNFGNEIQTKTVKPNAPVPDLFMDSTPVNDNNNNINFLQENSNDMNLLGDEFGISADPKTVQIDEDDILGMTVAKPSKKKNILSDGLDEKLNNSEEKFKTNKVEKPSKPLKRKGLGKPKTKLKKQSQTKIDSVSQLDITTDNGTNDFDVDLLGVAPMKQPKHNSGSNDLDLLDDIDLIGSDPVLNSCGDLTLDQTNHVKNTDNYAALDQMEDGLLNGSAQTKQPVKIDAPMDLNLNPQSNPNNAIIDYDCLNLDNGLEGTPNSQKNTKYFNPGLINPNLLPSNISKSEDDGFGDDDDEFLECEVEEQVSSIKYKVFFTNAEIKLEHSMQTSGLNVYNITNYFSNLQNSALSSVRLDISVPKHIKVKKNKLTGATLPGYSHRGLTQVLELEDQNGFAKPLKIKMMLRYTLEGINKVEKFMVDSFESL